ncbi:MAG TPA: hypothetical protein VI643_00780 [Planctomycetota bacterium]|nr:hypothetical protein [Planctomycetota bacterium]
MTDRYWVILETEPFVDPRIVADELARIKGIPALEAKRRVRRGVGIVDEDLGESEASALHEILSAAGVPARVVLADALPEFPAMEIYSQVEAGDDGIELKSTDGREQAMLVWDQIELVNPALVFESGYVDRSEGFEVGMIPGIRELESEEARVVRENLILKLRSDKSPAKAGPSVLSLLEGGKLKQCTAAVDLVGRDAACWFRVPARTLVFRKGRLRLGGELAFSKLLREIVEKCEKTALSPLTLKLIRGDDIKGVAFSDQREFAQHTRWQLVLKLTGANE